MFHVCHVADVVGRRVIVFNVMKKVSYCHIQYSGTKICIEGTSEAMIKWCRIDICQKF